jgi:hypothetical protein
MTHSRGARAASRSTSPSSSSNSRPCAVWLAPVAPPPAAASPPQARSGQQPAQLGAGRARDRRQLGRVQLAGQAPQRLDHRRERHAFLAQRHAAAAQHPHALLLRYRGELLDQAGLADPGLPADHRYQRRAVGGMAQQLAQPRQLLSAADKTAPGDLVGHAGPIMPRRF